MQEHGQIRVAWKLLPSVQQIEVLLRLPEFRENSLETKKIHSWRSGMAGKSFKTFIWAESGLSRASKNLAEMHRPDHDFGPRRMLADSVAEQGLNIDFLIKY